MGKRNKKYGNKDLQGISKDIMSNPNRNDFKNYFNFFTQYDSNVYHRKYNLQEIEDLILGNIYQMRCVNQNILSSVGKGYTENTDKEITEKLPIQEVTELVSDYFYFGEGWVEHTILGRKIEYTSSLPTYTMTRGKDGKYKDKAIQNYNTKQEIIYNILDIDEYKAGRVRSGVYVQQIKWGRKIYGIPLWIAGLETLKRMNYSDIDISAYYENNCIPYRMLITYGLPASLSTGESYVSFFERQFQGIGDKRKLGIIQNPNTKDLSEIEIKELQDNVITDVSLKLRESSQYDICAANSVPYWMAGIPGKGSSMGATGERQIETALYESEFIEPMRNKIIQEINIWHPDKNVDFNRFEFPQIETTEEIIIEQEKQRRIDNAITDYMENKNELDNSRPNK